MNLTRGINLRKISEMMPGASGAEVKGVCTEAGMYALRERRVHVTQEDFEMAVAKVSYPACDLFKNSNMHRPDMSLVVCNILSPNPKPQTSLDLQIDCYRLTYNLYNVKWSFCE